MEHSSLNQYNNIEHPLFEGLFAYKKNYIFAKAKGCLIFQAEIKPYEPDTGNSVVGICS